MVTRGKQVDIRYMAGIVDGEGTISVRCSTSGIYQLDLLVSGTDLRLMEALRETFGGRVRVVNRWPDKPWKTLYRWYMVGQVSLPILKGIKPHLIIKREQAELAIEFLTELSPGQGRLPSEYQKRRREEVVNFFRSLNARGRAAAETKRRNTHEE